MSYLYKFKALYVIEISCAFKNFNTASLVHISYFPQLKLVICYRKSYYGRLRSRGKLPQSVSGCWQGEVQKMKRNHDSAFMITFLFFIVIYLYSVWRPGCLELMQKKMNTDFWGDLIHFNEYVQEIPEQRDVTTTSECNFCSLNFFAHDSFNLLDILLQ